MAAVRAVVVLLAGVLAASAPAEAWVAAAHAKIAEAAVEALPDSIPQFFREGAARVGRSAIDPDYYRLRDLPQLRNAGSPERCLDAELLDGAEWPATRYAYLQLLAELDRNAYAVGMLPYSLAEGVQLLAASFAQVRMNPDDEWAQAKALHHAGLMAHYSADLCQPLHTTIHFNGRVRPDGSSPGSGIHFKADSLASAVLAQSKPIAVQVEPASDLQAAIRSEFTASHALVNRVYELESGLGPENVSPEALEFGRERVGAAIRFTSSLMVSALEISGEVRVPGWFRQLQPAPPAETAVSPR